MAYQDTNWLHLAGGSTATSAATLHDLYGGTYTGLSRLNASQVVRLQVATSNSFARLGASFTGLQPYAYNSIWLAPSNIVVELPPMLVHDASQMKLMRHTAENVVVFWNLWMRRPL